MPSYTVTLTDAENKALGIVSYSQQVWIDNVVHERCRVASDEIVSEEIRRLWKAGLPIPATADEIIMNAPIPSAAEREANQPPLPTNSLV
jgi:hypothetical protein